MLVAPSSHVRMYRKPPTIMIMNHRHDDQTRSSAATSLLLLVLTAAGLLLSSCGSSEATRGGYGRTQGTSPISSMAMPVDTSYIMIGDSVSLSVWGYPDFSTRTNVKSTGTISIPLIGEQAAAGLKKDQLTQELRAKLAEYIKGEVRISLDVERPSPRIIVLGMVARPGSFLATSDAPLLEVLAEVGGWTEQSDLRYIQINRQWVTGTDPSALLVDLEWYLDHGYTHGIPVVRPGDVVIVPRKENIVRDVSDFLRDAFILLGVFRLVQ